MQKNINRVLLLIIACLVLTLVYRMSNKFNDSSTVVAQTQTIDDTPKKVVLDKVEVEGVIKDYLMNNPEVIIMAVERLQKQKANEISEKSQEYLKEKNSEIHDVVNSPFLGNPSGDFIIVVFYDYNCSYCKKGDKYIEQLIEKYNNIKVILKPFPILGEDSIYLAKLALSVYKIAPEKFTLVHKALINMQGANKEMITKILEDNAINVQVIEEEMQKSEIQDLINKNFELANDLGLRGAPAYIVNGKLIPGLIKLEAFEKMIKESTENKH